MAELCYTIHGQKLDVSGSEDGELYINASEIKRAGFALFRKDAFNHSLKNDQMDGFTLHLLSEAKNYILRNKVTAIDEEIILKTIEKCKQQLMKDNVETNQSDSSRHVHYSPKSPGFSVTVSNEQFQNHHENNRNYNRARSHDRNSLPNNNFNKAGSENWTPRKSLNFNHESRNTQWTNQGNRNFQNSSGNNYNQERQEFRKPANYDNSQRGERSNYHNSGQRQNQEFSKPGNFSGDKSYNRRENFQTEQNQGFSKPGNFSNDKSYNKKENFQTEQNQGFSKPGGNFSRDGNFNRRGNFQREQNQEFPKPGNFSHDGNSNRRENFQRDQYQNKQTRNFDNSNFKPRESNLKPEIENKEVIKSNVYNNTKMAQNEQTNFPKPNLRPPKSVQDDTDNSTSFQPRQSPKLEPETTAQIENEKVTKSSVYNNTKIGQEHKVIDSKTLEEASKPAEKIEVEKPQPKNLPQSNLELGSVHKVQISYAHPDKPNICWVQLQESLEAFNEMMFQILEEEPNFPVESNVQKGQLVLGLYEDVWCRGEVISLNPTVVSFMDYGNQSEVASVKKLPEKFKKFPAFAFQVEIKEVDEELEDGLELTIEVRKHNGQVTLVDLVQDKPAVQIEKTDKPRVEEEPKQKVNEKVEEPKQEVKKKVEEPKQEVKEKVQEPKKEVKQKEYFNLPKQLKSLANDKKIKLLEFRDGTLFVKTKECVEKSNELNAYIQKLDLAARTLSTVKEGQLVLGNRHGMTGLCRAIVIKKVSDTSVTVRYLDYPGSDNLSVKYLRNIDDYLAEFPITLLMFPKTDMLDNLKGKELEFLKGLIEKQTIVTMIVSDASINLKLKTGELLSEALQNLSKPVNVPKPETIIEEPQVKEMEKSTDNAVKNDVNETDDKTMYDDMAWVELKEQDYDLFCYYIKDASELVMLLMDKKGEEYVEKLIGFNMKDTKPYAPEQYEMCMGYYKSVGDSEEVWYRVMIVDIQGDDYVVTSVDYGGEATIKSNNLRKLPKELKEVPILGIRCELADLPSSKIINNKLTELIQPGELYNVTVKGLNNDTLGYIIEIPGIRDELKKSGLI